MGGWMAGWLDAGMEDWMDGWTDRWTDGWLEEGPDRRMHGGREEWMDDLWMDGLRNGLKDGWEKISKWSTVSYLLNQLMSESIYLKLVEVNTNKNSILCPTSISHRSASLHLVAYEYHCCNSISIYPACLGRGVMLQLLSTKRMCLFVGFFPQYTSSKTHRTCLFCHRRIRQIIRSTMDSALMKVLTHPQDADLIKTWCRCANERRLVH